MRRLPTAYIPAGIVEPGRRNRGVHFLFGKLRQFLMQLPAHFREFPQQIGKRSSEVHHFTGVYLLHRIPAFPKSFSRALEKTSFTGTFQRGGLCKKMQLFDRP